MTSRDNLMTSRDNLMTSRNFRMTSCDNLMTSRDILMTSRDILMTSFQGTVSYVPQVSWVLNDTLKNNILFGGKWDKCWYKNVVVSWLV